MGRVVRADRCPTCNPATVLHPESYARRAADQAHGADVSEFSLDNLLAATTLPITHDGTQRRPRHTPDSNRTGSPEQHLEPPRV